MNTTYKFKSTEFDGSKKNEPIESVVCGVEATAEEELRRKLKESILANLDEIVEKVARNNFQLRFVSELGQELSPDVYKMMQIAPKGHALIQYTYQVEPGYPSYKTGYYYAPEGTKVDYKTLKAGEYYQAWDCHTNDPVNPPWAQFCIKL